MCGIAGIIAYREHSAPVDHSELKEIRNSMAKRGPDGEGIWFSGDGRTGLAHRRLAIIDLSEAGAQPMSTADDRLHITFNGEIYNYQELRGELAARGVQFRSTSDTEVLLHLYAERGAAMVDALRGMYTFGIWDENNKSLFLARDPFGIKPLYYADDGKTLRFASQVKALMAGGAVDKTPEPAGHVGFFVMGSVPEPFTLYRAIRALPAGSTLTLRRGATPVLNCFFDIAEETVRATETSRQLPHREKRALLREALADSIRHHMIADVPVGLFLSSGLDSSTVAAFACESERSRLHSITLGFLEYRGTSEDEAPLAALTARQLGTVHETRWITSDVFALEVEKLLQAMDQPSIDGVNTYFVSKAAADSGMKVALSGLGGDELFGGYPSFADVPKLARTFRPVRSVPWLGALARRLSAPLLKPFASPKLASLLEYGGSFPGAYLLRRGLYMPWELSKFMDPRMLEDGWGELNLMERLGASIAGIDNDRQRVSALEFSWYMRNQLLRDADWAGMAHSLEIRVPMVDVELFRTVMPLLATADPPTKVDMAKSAVRALPQELFTRGKTGFSIPVQQWARKSRLTKGPQRQLRNWAHIVHRPYKKIRVLALLSDAFGGHGGIALYNRDFLSTVCSMENISEVVAVPRLIRDDPGMLPAKLVYRKDAANSKLKYLWTVGGILAREQDFDLIICCHINLLVLAIAAKLRFKAPLMTLIYGIDAWEPLRAPKRFLLRGVDQFVSISDVTRRKFQNWAGVRKRKISLLPNAIHTPWYGVGPRNPGLMDRYDLHDKVVIMTLGRLVSSERYKGFDEVIDVMPGLMTKIPNLVYLIVGDGSDKDRLTTKVNELGLAEHVRFAGMVPETEKADHYRLADVYVMPSRGEGFGFVFLEAMACGIPVVASKLDGGREAVLDGQLGVLVDPDNPSDIRRGILEALAKRTGVIPEGLQHYSFENFEKRSHDVVNHLILAF